MIKVEKIGGFGDKIRLTNGIVDIEFATSFGPRILRYALCNRENFFYEDVEDLGNKGKEDMKDFEEGATWHIYGGHRFWQAPELLPRTYLPDNTPIEYELTEKGVILKQRMFEYTKTQAQIEVIMSDDSADVTVIHTLKSFNPWEVEIAPWTISVMARNVIEAVPVNRVDTGLLHNQTITVWPYTKLNDERVYFGEEYITLRQDFSVDRSFKLGFTNPNKFAAVFNDNAMFVKTFDYHKGEKYADDGMNFETYTDKEILECESLGRLQKMNLGDTITHTEKWTIVDGVSIKDQKDEEAIKKHLLKYRLDK